MNKLDVAILFEQTATSRKALLPDVPSRTRCGNKFSKAFPDRFSRGCIRIFVVNTADFFCCYVHMVTPISGGSAPEIGCETGFENERYATR